MRFSELRLFGYDAQLVKDRQQLDDVIDVAADVARDRVALTGLEDVVEALRVTLEYARTMMQQVQYKELQRANTGAKIDTLYNEPANATRTFTRSPMVYCHVAYADPTIKHEKTGWDYNQPIKCNAALLHFRQLDYYPSMGDEIIWAGRAYQVTRVYFSVDRFFANTGIPLWVTIEAAILRQGDGAPPLHLSDHKNKPLAAPLAQRLRRGQQDSTSPL